MKIGESGYVQNTKLILSSAENARKAIKNEIPEVMLASRHFTSVVAITTRSDVANPINVIALADVMKDKFKWNLNKLQSPSGLHIAFTVGNSPFWRKFVDDLKNSIKMMLDDPKLNHNDSTAFYGMAAKIPDSKILGDVAKIYNGAILDAI